jgi:AbiV family abortive infection protein
MKPKRVIEQYVGRLSPEQASEGITAAQDNARGLLADAVLLLDHGRWARAAALAILAIEEAGKVDVLRAILLARDEREARDEWRDYRSHTRKNAHWIIGHLAAKGARRLEDLRPIVREGSAHPHMLEATKQMALYSDAYGTCRWSRPEREIDEPLARWLVELAQLLSPDEEGSAMTSAAELAVWVKHLKPVWKGDMATMKRALIACYTEAQALGLLKGNITADDMAKFVD